MPFNGISRLVRPAQGNQLILLDVEKLAALDAHVLFQRRASFQPEPCKAFADFFAVIAVLGFPQNLPPEDVNVRVALRVGIYRPAAHHAVIAQTLSLNYNIIINLRVQYRICTSEKFAVGGGELVQHRLFPVVNIILARLHAQSADAVISDTPGDHFVKFQQDIGVSHSCAFCPIGIRAVRQVSHGPVLKLLRLAVVVVRKLRHRRVDHQSVAAVQHQDALHRAENVRPFRDLIDPVQRPEKRPVQVTPFVVQVPGHGILSRHHGLRGVVDVKHALRQIEFRPVREHQPLAESDLRPEPDLVHLK